MKDNKFKVLLRDYGYRIEGNLIIQNGFHGYSERIFGRCRSMMDAAEQLCPIIADDEYTKRLIVLTKST